MDGGLDFPSADIALRYEDGQVEHVPLYSLRKHLLKLAYTRMFREWQCHTHFELSKVGRHLHVYMTP